MGMEKWYPLRLLMAQEAALIRELSEMKPSGRCWQVVEKYLCAMFYQGFTKMSLVLLGRNNYRESLRSPRDTFTHLQMFSSHVCIAFSSYSHSRSSYAFFMSNKIVRKWQVRNSVFRRAHFFCDDSNMNLRITYVISPYGKCASIPY